MVERTRLLGNSAGRFGSARPPTRRQGTQLHSIGGVGRRLIRGGVQGKRYVIDLGSREVARHPRGGGAVPRIPVANDEAMRDVEQAAWRGERTRRETRDDTRAGSSTARRGPALHGKLPMELALTTVAIPNPAMTIPRSACGPSPGALFASGPRRSGMLLFVYRVRFNSSFG